MRWCLCWHKRHLNAKDWNETGVPTALITGITGQDGSYLAEFLLARGYRVVGLVQPCNSSGRHRLSAFEEKVTLVQANLLDQQRLRSVIEEYAPSEIYNCAARASSSQLFSDPLLTSEYNGLAVARQLELIRTIDPTIRYCQASSSEMFCNATESPQDESTRLQPWNPYGIAMLIAHGIVGSYRESNSIFYLLWHPIQPRESATPSRIDYAEDFYDRRARIAAGLESPLASG